MTKKYKYLLWASRHGGEHTIGLIDQKIADYWLEKGKDEDSVYDDRFEEYMWAEPADDRLELNKKWSVPKEFQIEEYWHDVTDIEHMNGCEFHDTNCLNVVDEETNKEVAEVYMTEDKLGSVFDPVADGVPGVDMTDKAIVYGQSFEKGGWNFEALEIDEPFDPSKVKFDVTIWSELKIVHAVDYDGQSLCVEDGDSWGKSMAIWIDD